MLDHPLGYSSSDIKNCVIAGLNKFAEEHSNTLLLFLQNHAPALLITAGVMLAGALMALLSHRHDWLRRPLMVAYLVAAVIYLVWRPLYSIPWHADNPWATIIGVAFYAVEIWGFTQIFNFIMMFWTRPASHQARPLPANPPSVDIFLATYNEPVELLERSVVAALQLDYPAEKLTVYICDDGDRPSMRELADKWGVRYLRRDNNDGAKAGNLNNAMAHSSGELVVTMDADMVLKPEFLQETVGHFSQQHELGFVQTPQAFHNADIFQHNLFATRMLRNDQDFFMRFMEPAYGRLNSTLYIGSNAIFRRQALEDIGGFIDDVITEDMATGVVLHNHGWRSLYVNKVLATGLSPETYPELIKQRIRWGRGNIQVLKKYGPHTQKNLSFAQKWVLWNAGQYWFFGVFHFFNWVLPITTLIFGLHIVRNDAVWFIPLWALQFVLARLVYEAISKGRFKSTWTMIYELAQGPQVGWAVLQEFLFAKSIGFHVTRKDGHLAHAQFSLKQSLPQVLIYLITLVVVGYSLYRAMMWEGMYPLAQLIPLVWLSYYAICLFAAILVAIDQPRQRHHLAAYELSGYLELSGHPSLVAVDLTGIHAERLCFRVNSEEWPVVRSTRQATLIIDGFAPLAVYFQQARKVGEELFIFADLKDLSPKNYEALSHLLNALNSQAFHQRPPRTHAIAYDATLGMLARRRPASREAYLTDGAKKYEELSFTDEH